jgi:hypothetical protein
MTFTASQGRRYEESADLMVKATISLGGEGRQRSQPGVTPL